MLSDTMAGSRTTKPSSTRTPRSDGRRKPATKAQTFAEIGKQAMYAAQKAALLEACTEASWKLAVVAERLSMGDASAVIRALKKLAPDAYEAAKKAGQVAPGKPREE